MHKSNKHTYCLVFLITCMVHHTVQSAIVLPVFLAKGIAAIAAKWATLKTIVVFGKVTLENIVMVAGSCAAAAGTLALCDKLWNMAAAKLAPSQRKILDALQCQQKRLNEKAIRENAALRQQIETIKEQLRHSENHALAILEEVQSKFVQYCETYNIQDSTSDALPEEGKTLRANVLLVACCLRIVYP